MTTELLKKIAETNEWWAIAPELLLGCSALALLALEIVLPKRDHRYIPHFAIALQATIFVLTNDEAGDARLVSELKQAKYDGVAIGGYINGQDAVNFPATEETTAWFNRVLNIVHANAPSSKIILVRGPQDVVPAIERVLGKSLPS